ncbi:MAG TPA: right-handed parallel beta-helix repeat-containing protein [Candidatus Hydrogenedens sp.]|nr:right-handed parallel beta-helix repeat-containing protein [Candidatus Hydrogenedens sp.]
MNAIMLKKVPLKYMIYANKLLGTALLTFCFSLLISTFSSGERIVTPGEDLVQVIQDETDESIFLMQTGPSKPTVYEINQPIIVDRPISLVGVDNTATPSTNRLPTEVVIKGNNIFQGVIKGGDFEPPDSSVWNVDINPPDLYDPSYSIIEENTRALSPTHLALFKGISEPLVPDQISQDFKFPFNPINTGPISVIDDPEVYQDILLAKVGLVVDILETQPIMFPKGTEPTKLSYAENTGLSLLNPLPIDLSGLVDAKLQFKIMRDNGPINPDDIIEISIKMGTLDSVVLSIPIATILNPMAWEPWEFDILSLIQQFSGGENPIITLNIKKLGAGDNTVYFDDFVLFLDFNLLPDVPIPIVCGGFDGGLCAPWIGVGNWAIVNDPVEGDQCLMLGPSPEQVRQVWLEFYVKTDVFSGKSTDQLKILFDGVMPPLQLLAELSPGNWTPLIEYRPNAFPNTDQYTRILAEIPSGLTNDNSPHRVSFISQVAPSAVSPDSLDPNTTVFLLDDVNFLVGSITDLRPPEPGYIIPNGNFESGVDGSWILTTTPVIPERDINDVIVPEGGYTAPWCAHLGDVPPAKISFFVKPVNIVAPTDYFVVWLGDNENITAKVIYDSRVNGMPALGVWTKIERWLTPPLLGEGDSSFELHVKAHIISISPGNYILFDDFCVSPYGGLGSVVSPNDVCYQNAIQNPSFEIDPDTYWNKNAIALAMGPIHCYDLNSSDCTLPEPPITGMRALRFSGIDMKPSLMFWLKIVDATDDSESELEILIDGQVIKAIRANDNTLWNGYQPITICDELIPFLDMAQHRLTIRIKPECLKEPVKYLIDDFCFGYKVFLMQNALVCYPNLLLDPSFEAGYSTPWEVLPDNSIIKGGPTGFPEAHTGVWYVELKQKQPDIRVLWQEEINIPTSADNLQFIIRVSKGDFPENSKISVYWDTLNGTPVWSATADDFPDGQWILEEIPLPYTTNPHILYFVYENCRTAHPSIFMIDDVAVVRSRFPLIEVRPGGDLCIESISLMKGSTGILNSGGVSKIYRCFIGPFLDDGITVISDSVASISQTVIHGNNIDGVVNQGTAVILQSTIRANGGKGVVSKGNGDTSVIASLIWENRSGGLIAESGATLRSGWNLVHPDVTSGVTLIGSPIGVFPSTVLFVDYPWTGKLRTPIPAMVSLDTIIKNYLPSSMRTYIVNSGCGETANLYPFVDFESDMRSLINVQVSADEVPIVGTILFWTMCKVSPVLPRQITGRERDIGIGNDFNVDIKVVGDITLSDSMLYLVPEEYVPYVVGAVDQLVQINKLPAELKKPVEITDISGKIGRAEFVINNLFLSDDDGIQFTTNGRARLFLRVGQILIGIYSEYGTLMRLPPADTEFIIDTIQPRLREDLLSYTAGGFVFQNNDIVSPPSGFTYPPNWCPDILKPMAYSSGTLGQVAHIFFNNREPLSFALQCAFYDPYPVDIAGNVRSVEVSGFNNNRTDVNVTGSSPIFDLIANGPIYEGFEPYPPGLGCAYIVLLNDVDSVLSYSTQPSLIYSMTYDTAQTGYTQPWQTARTVWQWLNLLFGIDWHIRVKFGVRDLSGNVLYEPANLTQGELNIWWMIDPDFEITTAPKFGEWTNNPQIMYKLTRSVSQKPTNADPCLSIVGIRVWTALDPFNYETTQWIPVDVFNNRWGWIIDRESLDKNTPIVFSNGSITTLGSVISDRKYCGALLMATMTGADEAGNVRPLPTVLLGNKVDAIGTLTANAVPLAVWRNPCDFDIDTNLQVDTWWNRCTADYPTWREVNYNFGERDFGAVQRVPLPLYEDACNYRVEMKLKMSIVIPTQGYAISQYGFDVQIFEDSNLVAGGTVYMLQGATTAEIYIPTDFMNPPNDNPTFNLNWYTSVSNFLNAPPTKCEGLPADRLGDEGSPEKGYRKRDVKYDIVVRAFAQDITTGALITDSTPTKVSVTIYPPVGDTERAITAPSQPKDEQKIKLFIHE